MVQFCIGNSLVLPTKSPPDMEPAIMSETSETPLPTAPSAPSNANHLKKKIFGGVLFILVLGLVELTARVVMPAPYQTGRRILLGADDSPLVRMQNTVGQAYLLYTPAPNYKGAEHGYHNADGYRGKAVPFEKQEGVLRVLCLGGSTTYGWSVPFPEEAYPAVLEQMLRERLPSGYTDVEVINAGLPWGTSAEMLTHYHFKFHYYKPDLVIINTGGNDAEGYTFPYYHPDNSNWRQPLVNLRSMPTQWRWLARSYFASYAILNIFYADQFNGGQFASQKDTPPAAAWFRPNGKLVAKRREIPDERLSFLHNVETLIREIQSDGASILLVPFRAAPNAYRNKGFELSQILRHEALLEKLAQKYQTGYAPFQVSVISPNNWTDHCHLNAAGEREKAAHIAEYVQRLL